MRKSFILLITLLLLPAFVLALPFDADSGDADNSSSTGFFAGIVAAGAAVGYGVYKIGKGFGYSASGLANSVGTAIGNGVKAVINDPVGSAKKVGEVVVNVGKAAGEAIVNTVKNPVETAKLNRPINASKLATKLITLPVGCNPPYPTVVSVCELKKKAL